MATHCAIETAQEHLAAIEQRGLCAQTLEDRGELDGNVAAADHQYAARQLLQVERLVGADRQLLAGYVRQLRPAPGGNQDVPGTVGLAVHFDLVRAEDARMAFQQADAAVDQQIAVDAVEALDFTVLVGDQRGPVEIRLTQVPAETGGLLEVLGEVGAIDQQLLRHAADIDAGAAQVAALGHRHAGTETGGEACRTNAAGAGTDHEQVEVMRHG